MKTVIVEDEEHSKKTLVSFLSKYCPAIQIQGVATTISEALVSIKTLQPELLFLDIDLPDGTSFEMLDMLPKPWPKIIFVTAYNQYAVKAFQISAMDYLLKPLDPQLLMEAVEKVVKMKDYPEHQVEKMKAFTENQKLGKLNKIAIPTLQGIQLLRIEEIIRLEADGNYTTIFLKDKTKYVVSRKIKEFEMMLEDMPFFRLHQSHIVNLQMIDRYIKGEGGTVILEDGTQIEVARRRKDAFLQQINA